MIEKVVQRFLAATKDQCDRHSFGCRSWKLIAEPQLLQVYVAQRYRVKTQRSQETSSPLERGPVRVEKRSPFVPWNLGSPRGVAEGMSVTVGINGSCIDVNILVTRF